MPVLIREAIRTDAEALVDHIQRLAEEPDIGITLGPGEFAFTVEEERGFIERYSALENSVFLVAVAGTQLVGNLICTGGNRKATRHAASLGISIARNWRNQGVGRAMIARAIDWAKSTGVLTRIELAVFAGNDAAIHLYETSGFRVEGRRCRAVYRNGKYIDDFIMALLI